MIDVSSGSFDEEKMKDVSTIVEVHHESQAKAKVVVFGCKKRDARTANPGKFSQDIARASTRRSW
jgi:hypothetical protein